MTNPDTDLLGDPIPEPLPEGIQLTDWDALVGHTIKAAITSPCGDNFAELLLVTNTNCWLAAKAEPDGCDDAELEVIRERYRYSNQPAWTIHDFASAQTLFSEGVISQTECHHLQKLEQEKKRQRAAERAASLRADADRAEREAGIAPSQAPNGST